MKALVLGGGGFLGGHVSRWLAARGHSLRILDLKLPNVLPVPPSPKVEYVEGNFLNAKDIALALTGGVDTVFHFVSTTVPASSLRNVPIEIEGNLAATVRLLDEMAALGVRRIVFPSSGGTIYGGSTEMHREDERPQPTCPYGLGKQLIEEVLRFYRQHRGIDYLVLRIANPYGDPSKVHLAQGAIDAFLHLIRAGRPLQIWGDGSAVRDFVFVDDVADAIGGLIERDVRNDIVNIGSGKGASIAEVVQIITEVVGTRVELQRMAAYSGPSHAVLDSSRLRELIGWQPRWDLRRGIAEAWRRLNG